MKLKKVTAMALAATMVLGSSITVFATETTTPTDANSATGTGTTFEHVDKEITSVTLPTTDAVQNVFNYYVDPERLINDAGTLADGATAVTGNDDGVYFKNSGTSGGSAAVDAAVTAYSIGGVTTGLTVTVPTTTTATTLTYCTIAIDSAGADGWYEDANECGTATPVTVTIEDDTNGSVPTPATGDTITVTPYQAAVPGTSGGYSSSSDAVEFEGKNSVDVDVSVKAEVTATEGGKDIALVADAEALKAATTPALLMTLKVGNDEKAITSSGVTASAKIAGVPDNFAVTTENNKYVYKIRTDVATTPLDDWDSTTVQLIGKTNTADVPAGANALTAPKIALTWTIAKHGATTAYVSSTEVSSANKALTLSLPDGVTVAKVVLNLNNANTTLTSGNHYTVSGTTLTISKYAAGWAGGTLTITYSDNHTDTITCK